MAVSPVQVMTVLAFVLLVCHVPWDALLRGAAWLGRGDLAEEPALLHIDEVLHRHLIDVGDAVLEDVEQMR